MRARHIKRIFTLFILLIAFSAGVYSQRVEVMEWYLKMGAPVLPDAIGYEEMTEQQEVKSTTGEDVTEAEVEEEAVIDSEVPQDSTEPDLEVVVEAEVNDPEVPVEQELPEEVVETLPESVNLAVPFTSQAPHGNWDEPYQESCEEASVYMVHSYYEGVSAGPIPPDTADLDLLNIVAFEKETFGYYEDTTAEKTGVLAELKFGHTYKLIENPTIEDIQTELAAGHPVLLPAAGRLLGNPYFTAPGPLYHMLVIRGYTTDGQFIVNDPGTSRGEAFVYDAETVLYAMHDWNDGGEITQGRKVVLVLYP
ncbi:C39 family peptidase [Candidatus Uhrbacteria bacterium]|nr:C39 family peptidase [Candidatus Uhrbacteria bacterium]